MAGGGGHHFFLGFLQCDAIGSNFCGDIVLDTFNKAFRDEDNILKQIIKEQICSDYYDKDVSFFTTFHENA